MSLSQAATEFLTGRPAGVSAVSRSAGLLTSWVENGFNCSVQRDPAGLPYMLVAERAGRGIRLTEAGEVAVSRVPNVLAAVNNEFLAGFSEAEWKQLRKLLGRMLDNGLALRDQPPTP